MGNEPATTKSTQGLDHFHQQFSVKERDPVRNLVYVVDQRSGREFVMRQLTTNDDMQKKRIEDLVIEKRTRKCKFVMRLEDYHMVQDKRYCLNQFKAYLLFESPHKDLREELLERRLKRTQFHDDELMSIMESVVMGLKYFKDIGQPHEAVCCSNILINRQGFIMLSDPWFSLDDTRLPNGDKIYMSPQRLQSHNMTRTARVDWYAADLWSLAMVVIEAANLQSIEGLYIKNNRQINYDLLRNKLEKINNPTIRKYVEGLLDNERRRIETANLIEQMVRTKNNNRTEGGYSRVSPHRTNQPATTTTTTTTNRAYTPSAAETIGSYVKQAEQFVTPTNVLQQQPQGGIATPPTVVQQQATYDYLQTRPFTNYIQGYQHSHKQLYGQTISPQPVQPLLNKNLYGSSSVANLHAVSPIKQPGQKLVQNSQSPPQQTKHNRSLTVTSKHVDANAPTSQRQRSNSGFKFNYPTPSALTTTTSANITGPGANIPATTPSYLNPTKSRVQPLQYPTAASQITDPLSSWSKQLSQTPNNFSGYQGHANPSAFGSTTSNTTPSSLVANNPPPSTLNNSNHNQSLMLSNSNITQQTNPASKLGSLLSSNPMNLTYSNAEPANVPSFIKKVPGHEANTYNASSGYSSNSNNYSSTYNSPMQPSKQAGPVPTYSGNIFTPSSITSLFSKSPSTEPKYGATSGEYTTAYNQSQSLAPTTSYPTAYSGTMQTAYNFATSSEKTQQPTIGLTASMSNYTKGLSAADAELFTKPQLLKDFTISTLRNTSSNETYGTKNNMDFNDLTNFKSSILENNLKQPTSGRMNNLKEVVLSSEHEFKGSNEIYHNPNDRNYLLDYGSYYGATKPETIKIQQVEVSKPALSVDPLPYSASATSVSPSTTQATGPTSQATTTSLATTRIDQNPPKIVEPEILQIVTTTYTDLKPEDFIKPAQQNLQPPKNEQHSTPNRRRGNNRNNSTIPEVPESEMSVEEELEYVVERYEVGSRYEGYKKNGLRNGRGKFFYQDGGFYDGNWKDDKMHGEGKLYYNETKLAYEGQWYLDEFHGHGKVYNDSPLLLDHPFDYGDFDQLDDYWVYYEGNDECNQGNLVADLKQGFGRLKLSNGQLYEGEWKCDRVDGRGRFITIRGEIINGVWRENKLVKVE